MPIPIVTRILSSPISPETLYQQELTVQVFYTTSLCLMEKKSVKGFKRVTIFFCIVMSKKMINVILPLIISESRGILRTLSNFYDGFYDKNAVRDCRQLSLLMLS